MAFVSGWHALSGHDMTASIHRRIAVLRMGVLEPLYAKAPVTCSPSPTLLVEGQHVARGHACTRAFISHVLTYFPDGALARLRGGVRGTRDITIPRRGVVLWPLQCVESVEWLVAAPQLSVQIDEKALAVPSRDADAGRREYTVSPGLLDTRIPVLLEALRSESMEGFPNGCLFLEGLEQSLVSCLVLGAGRWARSGSSRGGLAPYTARRLVEYMRANLAEDLSVVALARQAGLSASHLARAFRQTFRMTPHQSLIAFRIAHAKALLQGGDASLMDVAQRSGFKTQQHFSRVFRERVGMSPGHFRRRR
jgi:AraC family transcriptional regulator